MNNLVSIIICTCARPDDLQTTLKSIAGQRLDKDSFDYELWIVDNSPTGSMKAALQPVASLFDHRLEYLHEPTPGKSHALNAGIRKARGQILVFTDDDVVADPLWLKTLVDFLNRRACDGVGGRVLPIFPKKTPRWIRDNPVKIAGGVVIYDYGTESFQLTERQFPFIGCNFAFRREVFETCGLFRTDIGPGTEAMGEDTEFVERLLEHGKNLYYCADALIRHPVDLKRTGLRHIARWHIKLGRFAARREIEKKQNISVYYFGVPRYLWKGIITDGFVAMFSVFNPLAFLNTWRALFRKIGMILEYRKLNQPHDTRTLNYAESKRHYPDL